MGAGGEYLGSLDVSRSEVTPTPAWGAVPVGVGRKATLHGLDMAMRFALFTLQSVEGDTLVANMRIPLSVFFFFFS